MEKEFIPYEQALALKELGFDDYCLGLYAYASKNTVDMQHVIHTCKASSKLSWMRVPTPTFSQAFRWFRKKYGLSGNIDCCDKLCEWNIKSSKLDKSIFSNKIQSYEEAELECLKKIIELCKK